jgi:beta propeller repeat protein
MRNPAAAFLAAWAVSVSAAWAQFSPFLVDPAGGSQHNPDVSGSLVVWMEFVDGDYLVRGRDLATGSAFLIDEPNATELDPVTDGRLVVWRDNRAGNYNVYALDLQSGEERTIVDEPHSQGGHALGGDFVAWRDARNSPPGVPPEFGNMDIYALNLRTGQEFAVCTAPWDQKYPAVSGNIIVWADYRRANPILNPLISDIYGYDLSTGREFLIASADDDVRQVKPAISGSIVVWADMHNGGDIWGYDLDSNTSFPICVNPYGQNDVDIDGRYVVWEDWRNGVDKDIWGYDLLTAREFPIYQGPGNQGDPKISGNLVVWDSFDSGDQERVWAAYIPEPATILLLGAGAWFGLALKPTRRPGPLPSGSSHPS